MGGGGGVECNGGCCCCWRRDPPGDCASSSCICKWCGRHTNGSSSAAALWHCGAAGRARRAAVRPAARRG
eukprot:5581902-Prymnesium_polylepis.1